MTGKSRWTSGGYDIGGTALSKNFGNRKKSPRKRRSGRSSGRKGTLPEQQLPVESGGALASSRLKYQDAAAIAILAQSCVGDLDYDAIGVEIGDDIAARVQDTTTYDVYQVKTKATGEWKYSEPTLLKVLCKFAQLEREHGPRIRKYCFYSNQTLSGPPRRWSADLLKLKGRVSDRALRPFLGKVIAKLSFPRGLPLTDFLSVLAHDYVSALQPCATMESALLDHVTSALVERVEAKRATVQLSALKAWIDPRSSKWSEEIRVLRTMDKSQAFQTITAAQRGFSPQAPADQSGYLSGLVNRVRRRLSAGWSAFGVPPDCTETLVASVVSESEARHSEIDNPAPVQVFHGGLGTGKSMLACQLAISAAARRLSDHHAALPLYFTHEDISGIHEIKARAERDAGIRDLGVGRHLLIIDGVDQLGPAKASQLLQDIRSLVIGSESKAIIFTRCEIGAVGSERQHIPKYSEESAAKLFRAISGIEDFSRTRLSLLGERGRNEIAPIFVVAYAVAVRAEPRLQYGSKGAALRCVMEMCLARVAAQQSAHISTLLQDAASSATNAHCGFVPIAAIAKRADLREAAATGCIQLQEETFTFIHPLFAFWFAAQALLVGRARIEDVTRDARTTELWHTPITMFIALASEAEVDAALTAVAKVDGGCCASIVMEESRGWSLDVTVEPPTEASCAHRLRLAMAALLAPLGPLAYWMGHIVRENGSQWPMGIHRRGAELIGGWDCTRDSAEEWYHIDEHDIAPLIRAGRLILPGKDTDYGPLVSATAGWQKMARPAADVLWPWRWCLEEVKRSLKEIVRALPVELRASELIEEHAWMLARQMAGVNPSSMIQVELKARDVLEKVSDVLAKNPDQLLFKAKGSGFEFTSVDLVSLQQVCQGFVDSGLEWLQSPLPEPDKDIRTATSVYDLYSVDQLRRRIEVVFVKASKAYHRVMSEYFPHLAGRIDRFVYFPARLVMTLAVPAGSQAEAMAKIPTCSYHYVPLPSAASPEAVITIRQRDPDEWWPPENCTHPQLDEARARLAGLRGFVPDNVGWMTGVGVLRSEYTAPNPVYSLVRAWVAQGLTSIHWIDQ